MSKSDPVQFAEVVNLINIDPDLLNSARHMSTLSEIADFLGDKEDKDFIIRKILSKAGNDDENKIKMLSEYVDLRKRLFAVEERLENGGGKGLTNTQNTIKKELEFFE